MEGGIEVNLEKFGEPCATRTKGSTVTRNEHNVPAVQGPPNLL